MRILIFCPMYSGKLAIRRATVESIFALDWDHRCDVVFGREDKQPAQQAMDENITQKYNDARTMAINGDYDAMLTVEADMVIPAITLQRLTRVSADVVYGLYVSRHSKKWLVFDELTEAAGSYACDTEGFAKDAWGKVVESVGVGLGCTLIYKRALLDIPFRLDGFMSCDWYFSLDCIEQGFTQKHDLGVVCGHIDNNEILYPSLDPGLVRYEPLEGDTWLM